MLNMCNDVMKYLDLSLILLNVIYYVLVQIMPKTAIMFLLIILRSHLMT